MLAALPLIIVLLRGPGHAHLRQQRTAEHFWEQKTQWIQAYGRSGDFQQARRDSGVELYPATEQELIELERKWRFLREKRLNYFK
jgi:hypothetical protein